jgi:hypothetical protein
MGVVHAAVQEALGRQVAMKFLRYEPDLHPEARERFRAEAEAIARVQNPHIVQVFEAGEAGGRPFLAMELVTGGTLTQRLANGPIPPGQAAGLVRTLASAVAAAHAAGVVHRDLKPSNVVLTPEGTPKVSDFGIAKLLTPGQAGGTDPTATGVVLGTPSYMAPEQAAGAPRQVGPLVDVYALGAILYECLTGRVPFRAATVIETLNLVMTADPPPPRQLQPGLPRDLETICLKCLRKEPGQRYGSAEALAADLDRFLAGRPIMARPVGPLERTAKWARRNKALAALLVTAAVSVIAGAAGVVVHNRRLQAALTAKTIEEENARRERERADENYKHARAALRAMLDRLKDPKYADLPRLLELRKAQGETALAYFRTVAGQRDDPSPQVRYDAAKADYEAGELYRLLGDPANARTQYGAARAGLARLMAEDPGNRTYRFDHAFAVLNLGANGAKDEAVSLLTEAVAELRTVAADPAATAVERNSLASALTTLGAGYYNAKRYPEAEAAIKEGYDIRTALLAADPADAGLSRELAETMLNLSAVYRACNRPGPAAEYHDKCVATLQRLADADPDDPGTADSLARERVNWTYVQMGEKRYAEALDALGKSAAGLDRLIRREPNDARLRDAAFRVHAIRAEVHQMVGRFADETKDYERAVAFAAPERKRFYGWLLARARVKAGDFAGAVGDSERLLPQVLPGVPEGEPYFGAETCVAVASGLRLAAAVASTGVAPDVERVERLAVALLAKMKAAAGHKWVDSAADVENAPEFRSLQHRNDFRALFDRK